VCGIAGYFGPNPPSPDRQTACLRQMRRRGPDAQLSYRAELPNGRQVVFLHSRLAIIDLDHRADQPYRTDGGVLCYNGEIYNYGELRQRLAAEGETFTTGSDTEVLACGLARWGADRFLDAAEGMWAFAYHETASGRLLFSRDRFGEKPLYLMRMADGGVYFGSEVKFIATLTGQALRPNIDHLCRYLINGYKTLYKVRASFFEGIEELPAGTVLTVDPSGAETWRRYWTPSFAEKPDLTFEQSVSAVRESLIEAVRLRLRSDVPLAFCMSGGVDSNALISIAKRVFGYDVHGFTILNTDARYEEQSLVETAVRELGVRHTGVPLEKVGFLGNLRQLVRVHDAPVYTISYYVHWRLMAAIAAAGYKVAISGTGADELFTGYYDHQNLYLAEIAADPAAHAAALSAWEAHVKPIVRNPYLSDPDVFRRNPALRDHITLGSDKFSATLVKPWREAFTEKSYCSSNLRNRMLNELFEEVVPVILHEDDANAMDFSIENRSPFLDRRLCETASSVPTQHLVRDGFAKAVLRGAVRGIAPDAVVDCRRKVGFNAPLLDLLDVRDPAVKAELLADSPIWDVLQRDVISSLFEKSELGNSESKFLFNVLNAKMFLEECTGSGR